MAPNEQSDAFAFPEPLEPALAAFIIESYNGERDESGRYETTEETGPGAAKFTSGNYYKGHFSMGMMHGKGKYMWVDGTSYEGDFRWNSLDGEGAFRWADGSTYTGGVKQGFRHGSGSFVGPGGSPSYTGEWAGGKRHGSGTLWYDKDKDTFYEGEWLENRRHGHGRMRYKPRSGMMVASQGSPRLAKKKMVGGGKGAQEGNLYEGYWALDRKSGEGTMHWFDRKERYTGEWKRDLQHGKGEHLWIEDRPDLTAPAGVPKQMCNRYVGEWVDGERHGHGYFSYANGARYDGEWRHGLKQGWGVFYFEDGHTYQGPWGDDRPAAPDPDAPSKGPDPTMQPQLRLHVADLLPAHVDPVAEALQLEKTVLRYTSELRAVYKWYTALGHGALPAEGGVFAMSMAQFKRLWADCSLGAYNVSLSCVHRLRAQMAAQHQGEVEAKSAQAKAALAAAKGAARAAAEGRAAVGSVSGSSGVMGAAVTTSAHVQPDVYGGDQSLLFREFVELLARIAAAAFCDGQATARAGKNPGQEAKNGAGLEGGLATGRSTAMSTARSTASRGSTMRPGTSGQGFGASSRPGTSASAMSTTRSNARSTARSVSLASSTTGGPGLEDDPLDPLASDLAPEALQRSLLPDYVSPADALALLMTQAVQGAHSKPMVKGGFEYQLRDDPMQLVLEANSSRLRAAFHAFSLEPGGGGASSSRVGTALSSRVGSPTSRNDRTVNVASLGPLGFGSGGREPAGVLKLGGLLTLLSRAGAARPVSGGGLGLEANDVLRVLVVGQDEQPLLSDPTLLESDLVWAEFLEALAHLANTTKPADLPDPVDLARAAGKASSPLGVVGEDGEDEDLHEEGLEESLDTVGIDAWAANGRTGQNGWGGVGPGEKPLHKHLEALLNRLDLDRASAEKKAEKARAGGGGRAKGSQEGSTIAKRIPRPPRKPIGDLVL